MITFRSPAKINLFLRILRKRPDGFHELASLFQTVDLFDYLHVKLGSKDRLTCDNPKIPLDSSNLILKAADAFRSKTGISSGVEVHLEKNIPMEAGLGGGSSNAATLLWAFNQLTDCPLNETELRLLAGAIGSDTAFFLSQGTAYCTGRGEQIQLLDSVTPFAVTLVKPPIGLSTPLVYKNLQIDTLIVRDPQESLELFQSGRPVFYNDLEGTALMLRPELDRLKSLLVSAGFGTVLLSGSGTSFFCLGEGQKIQLPDHFFFSGASVNRLQGSWY